MWNWFFDLIWLKVISDPVTVEKWVLWFMVWNDETDA